MFPMISDEELDRLAESIADNGLIYPIKVDRDGLIVDGRNRYEAMSRAGLELADEDVEVWSGDDPASYIIGVNVERRHMSTGAQAMATARVLAESGKRQNGRWKRGSVDIGGSANISGWQSRLKEAGLVLDHMPELAQPVINGDLALDNAYRQVKDYLDQLARNKSYKEQQKALAKEKDKQKRRREQAMLTAMAEAKADTYLRLVHDGMSIAEAHAAWQTAIKQEEERERAEAYNRKTFFQGITRSIDTLASSDVPERADHELFPHLKELTTSLNRELTTSQIDKAIRHLNFIKKGLTP